MVGKGKMLLSSVLDQSSRRQRWLWDPENTYLFLLLVEVVNDDTNEEVQGKKGTKDDEDDEVDVHVEVDLVRWLFFNLASRDGK